jgi:hypothetical protein
MKKYLIVLSLFFAATVQGQFIQGSYVEIGIDNLQGFEGADVTGGAPAGMHFRSANPYFGFVANPLMDGWVQFDGDYFTPGTPENGWGFEMDTIKGSANCAGNFPEMSGSIVSNIVVGTTHELIWEGDYTTGTNLHFKLKYTLEDTALYYITEVTVTNNTTLPIPELYYYRNVDPDNNQSIGFDFTTQNTIIAQHVTGTPDRAFVSATSTVPSSQPMSYFAFLAIDTTLRASVGGFSNRDATDLYNGIGFTQTVGYTNYADEAIALACKLENIPATGSETFKFATLFTPDAEECATHALGMQIASVPVLQTTDAPYLLSAVPAGGTFSGLAVSGNMFDPSMYYGNIPVYYTHTDSVTGCSNTVSAIVTVVESTTSIAEQQTINFNIFPNPSNGNTSIDLSGVSDLQNTQVLVFDVAGREVFRKDNPNAVTVIDSKTLSPGMYFVKIITNNKVSGSQKLIIQK